MDNLIIFIKNREVAKTMFSSVYPALLQISVEVDEGARADIESKITEIIETYKRFY